MMLFERVEERDSGADKYGYYTAAHPSILVAPKKKKSRKFATTHFLIPQTCQLNIVVSGFFLQFFQFLVHKKTKLSKLIYDNVK